MSLYKSFVEKFSHIRLLNQVGSVLSWDQQTYMPIGAIDIRAKQLAYLASLAHREATSTMYQDHLAQMIDIDTEKIRLEGLSLMEQSNLRQWCRDLKKKNETTPKFY